jgi:RecB family exonuclease
MPIARSSSRTKSAIKSTDHGRENVNSLINAWRTPRYRTYLLPEPHSIPGVDPASWWWRRAFTDAAPLAEDGLLTTSYSRIGRYDNCPLQYVLESVLGLDPASTYQMRFGSLVHRIFERSDPVVGDITSLQEALDVYKQAFLEGHKDDYPNLMFARTYYTAGVRMIALWWETERRAGETISVEYSFDDLPVDGHVLRGRIDRVAKTSEGLVLTDYKTSSRMPRVEEARESLQLAIYYLAARHYDDLQHHGDPARMQLVFPGVEQTDRDTGAKRAGRRVQGAEDAEAAAARLVEILAEASSERFHPSPTADCQWCRMKPLCPRWPEGREVGP